MRQNFMRIAYDPQKPQYKEFDPFWEFVSGPLNAGSFGPNALDNTFGPQVIFQKFPPAANFSPFAGLQFFGQVDIDGRSGVMTVTLKDLNGASVFSQKLPPGARQSPPWHLKNGMKAVSDTKDLMES